MKISFKDRLYYRFELFLNKGGSSVFISVLIVFIIGAALMGGLRFAFLHIFQDSGSVYGFWKSIWVTFLQMTDPGSMSLDNPSPFWLKFAAILSGVTGIIVLSMFIAVITTTLETKLYNFRKGRGRVIESGHTLILGWNERVVDIIRELIIANESKKRASIVVLSEKDKDYMDDLITKRIQNSKSTRIVTTNGRISNVNELRRVNTKDAKSIIILADCSERACAEAKNSSDVQTIKTIMAIISAQMGKNHIPIIVEVFTEEKKEIVKYFGDQQIIAVDSWDIMGRLLMQTSLTSGLEVVYNEILSFNGCEVYFYKENWEDIPFYQLVFHFKDGIPLGIYSQTKGIVLRPPKETRINKGDALIILADDDSTIHYSDQRLYQSGKVDVLKNQLVRQKKKTLILGWHYVATYFIREAYEYLLKGSSFDIMFNQPGENLGASVESLKKMYPGFEINLIDANPLNYEHLEAAHPEQYDNIIILSQSLEEKSPDKIDSDTLIILLLLRKKIKDFKKTNIITQVLNSENQEIITQTDVDDFIISNKLITMIMAQISEDPLIKLFYDDIFSEEGSEIYVKPITLYFESFPVTKSFIDIIMVAGCRDEICLGIQKGDKKKRLDLNFGVELNISKDNMIIINENDYLIVLAENEL